MDTVQFLLVYVISAVAWYFSIRYMYNNHFKNISPGVFEIFVTFIPFVNTLWAIFNWLHILIDEVVNKNKEKKEKVTRNFFGIKR